MQEAKTHQLGNEQLRDLQDRLRDSELDRAREVWQAWCAAGLAEARKQVRFMMARGFSRSVVGKIIRGAEDEGLGREMTGMRAAAYLCTHEGYSCEVGVVVVPLMTAARRHVDAGQPLHRLGLPDVAATIACGQFVAQDVSGQTSAAC
jgi:hypothetical protein